MLKLADCFEQRKNTAHKQTLSVPDALISWTTSGALVAFGIIFFDDAVIMGHTILLLGLLSAANEVLKFRPGAEAICGASGSAWR